MKRRKLAKRIKRLERRIEALEAARTWEPTTPLDVTGAELDVHELLAQCVTLWQHGYDDGEDWSGRGYL